MRFVLKPGTLAPDFALPDARGRVHRLSDFRGRRVVLYFYPKDLTPACTRQACGFRDHFAAYAVEGVEVIGVSLDPPKRHEEFALKYNLPFLLLSDEDAAASRAYGVYGGKSWGIMRTTFVVAPDGTIERVFRKVKTDTHAVDVLRTLASPASG